MNPIMSTGDAPLATAAFQDHKECVSLLLKKGADVNRCNRRNETALVRSITRRASESMELLIKAGADVNTTDLSGRTPLMYAASTSFVKCISLLLIFNAKINLRDKNGQNAIEVNIVELDGEISNEGTP